MIFFRVEPFGSMRDDLRSAFQTQWLLAAWSSSPPDLRQLILDFDAAGNAEEMSDAEWEQARQEMRDQRRGD